MEAARSAQQLDSLRHWVKIGKQAGDQRRRVVPQGEMPDSLDLIARAIQEE
jgi:hypothetical protein